MSWAVVLPFLLPKKPYVSFRLLLCMLRTYYSEPTPSNAHIIIAYFTCCFVTSSQWQTIGWNGVFISICNCLNFFFCLQRNINSLSFLHNILIKIPLNFSIWNLDLAYSSSNSEKNTVMKITTSAFFVKLFSFSINLHFLWVKSQWLNWITKKKEPKTYPIKRYKRKKVPTLAFCLFCVDCI